MGYKTDETRGVTPIEDALYWESVQEDGTRIFATIPAYSIDNHGRYHAWVHHPVYGQEIMTEKEGRLEHFTPVRAVTEKNVNELVVPAVVEAVVEKYEARIAELETLVGEMLVEMGKAGLLKTEKKVKIDDESVVA